MTTARTPGARLSAYTMMQNLLATLRAGKDLELAKDAADWAVRLKELDQPAKPRRGRRRNAQPSAA